jgi:hypothetical protein
VHTAPDDKGCRADLVRTYRALIELLYAIGEREHIEELDRRAKQLAEK